MPEKILIVDDDADSRKLVGLMLERQGYEVVIADSGQQALSLARSAAPQLVVLDIMMPDMDGYEVCRRLRQDTETRAIPIIMFTAKTMVDDKVAGFEAGADDYITKPTQPAELASRVKAVLSRSASQDSARGEGALLLGFIGAKGGVGTTTLAVNVAAALARAEPTILADFRFGQGTIGRALGLERSSGMTNLIARPAGEITLRAVENELATYAGGLRVLLSSTRPKEALLSVSPDSATLIVRHLRALARYVLLDLGGGLSRLNARLIPDLDQLTLAVEPQRTALAMARELLQEVALIGLPRGSVSLVMLNRAEAGPQVPWQEAEHLLEHEITAIIAAAPELTFRAADAGAPLLQIEPSSAVAGQFAKLAEQLASRRT